MIGQRKGGNSVSTKSKIAPVNISQNDYLALSLCLLCITILRRRIRHRTRVGKNADKILVLLSLSQYSFDFIFHITDLASTISINSSITSFVHTFLVLEAILQIQLFPPFLPCAFYLVKKNCIISKLNSDWLILIKVYPSFKKNRMRFYSIKVLQSFL